MDSKLQSNKDRRFKLTSDNGDLAIEVESKIFVFTSDKVVHKVDV